MEGNFSSFDNNNNITYAEDISSDLLTLNVSDFFVELYFNFSTTATTLPDIILTQDWWNLTTTTEELDEETGLITWTSSTSIYDDYADFSVNNQSGNKNNSVTKDFNSVVVTTTTTYNWYFLILLLFAVAGGLGNTLVCLAICLERRLQNVTNYFLLSLAVADLLVSLVVMPFGIIVGFIGHWPFGATMCNVYVSCDVLACSSSIMHMCFISIGRYLGIRNPLKTRNNSKKRVGIKIVLVWLLSMVISSPISILGIVDTDNIQAQVGMCAINNQFFFIFGSLFAFYIPMVFMVVSYVLTVQLLRQQKKFGDNLPVSRRIQLSCRRYKQQQKQTLRTSGSSDEDTSSSSFVISRSLSSLSRQSLPVRSSYDEDTSASAITTCPVTSTWIHNNGHIRYRVPRFSQVSTCDRGTQTQASDQRHSMMTRSRSLRLIIPKTPSSFHLRFLATRKRSSSIVSNSVANEQKASKVLGIVFSTFVVCWTPFFILNIVFAACPSCEVSINIVDTCLWLGYVSSTINPIIYTIFNRTFKEAFIRLLLCRCANFQKKQRRRHTGGAVTSTTTSMYRYVDNPSSQNSLRLNSPTGNTNNPDGQESIC